MPRRKDSADRDTRLPQRVPLVSEWLPYSDLTIFYDVRLRQFAAELGVSRDKLHDLLTGHERLHRIFHPTGLFMGLQSAIGSTIRKVLERKDSSHADEQIFAEEVFAQALVHRRLSDDMEPVSEAAALFLTEYVMERSARSPSSLRLARRVSQGTLTQGQRPFYDALHRLKDWSGSYEVAMLVLRFAFASNPVQPRECSLLLPMRFSAQWRFWEVYDLLESIHEVKGLKNLSEVTAISRIESGPISTPPAAVRSLMHRIFSFAGNPENVPIRLPIGEDYPLGAPKGPRSTRFEVGKFPVMSLWHPPTKKFDRMRLEHRVELFDTSSGAAPNLFASVATLWLGDSHTAGAPSIFWREGIDPDERFPYILKAVAEVATRQLWQGAKPVECFLKTQGFCGTPCEVGCGPLLVSFEEANEVLIRNKQGPFAKAWDELSGSSKRPEVA